MALFLMRFIAKSFPSARLWGFNHLIFLPDQYTMIFAIVSIIALILPFIPGIRRLDSVGLSGFAGIFFDSPRKYVYRLIFIIISGAIFTIFTAPVHFLGDGYSLIANLGSDSGTFFKWSEKWITVLLMQIQNLLGPRNPQTARTAFQIVSIFSGIVSIWFFFMIAELMSKDRVIRSLTLAILMISSITLLFFGYVENYPLTWPPLCGFIYFGIKRIKNGSGTIAAGLFLLGGILVHLQMAVLVPAYLFLLFSDGKGLSIYKKYKSIIWGIVAAGLIGFIVVFVLKYRSDLYFQNIFLPLLKGKDIYPEYSLLSLRHLLDIANELLLLSPLLPWLIYVSVKNISLVRKSKELVFLALIAVFCLLFLLIIDPKLAMARDWDLFSFSAIGLNLLFIMLINPRTTKVVQRLMPTFVLYLIIALVPLLLVNLNKDRSIKYLDYIIELDRKKSFSSLVTLRNYYRDNGDEIEADKVRNNLDRYFPNEKRMDQAFRALDYNNVSLAKTILRSVDPDKYSAIYHNLLSMLNLYTDNYDEALAESKKALQLRQYDPLLICNHAMILSTMERNDEAASALKRAFRLDSANMVVLEGLATVYMKSANIDSVYRYAMKMIAKDSTKSAAYFMLARTYALIGDLDNARIYCDRFKAIGTAGPYFEAKCSELEALINR
ncbi:MAG: hypothetical protein AB1746_03080 [Candidatus Zixiibacteriota bacterium]